MAKREDQLKKLCENQAFAEKLISLTKADEAVKLFKENGISMEKAEAESLMKMLKLEKEGKLSAKMKEDILQGEIPDELLEEVNGGFIFALICAIVAVATAVATTVVTVKQVNAAKDAQKKQEKANANQIGAGSGEASGDAIGGGGSLQGLI